MYSPPHYPSTISNSPYSNVQYRQTYSPNITEYPSNNNIYQSRQLSYSPIKTVNNANNYMAGSYNAQGTTSYLIPNSSIPVSSFNEYGL